MSKRFRNLGLLLVVLVLSLVAGLTQYHADAGSKAGGKMYSYASIDSNDTVVHRVLLAQEVHTMPNTTPVVGDTVCLPGDPDAFAARLTLTGTMTGTAPVVTIVLQSSDDGGTTWTNVGSAFAAINATVTPAAGAERITFADTAAGAVNTPVLYGECFRVRYTWAGTGTVTANVGVMLYAE